MVSIERAIGFAIVGAIAATVIYKIIGTPQPTSIIRQPTPSVTGGVAYIPYPSPYPVSPPEGEYYTEGPSQEESMDLALNYTMSQPPYTTLSCTSPVCTDVDTLRVPYGWRFRFEFTCDPLAVMRVAYVTVINGSVTDFSVTP